LYTLSHNFDRSQLIWTKLLDKSAVLLPDSRTTCDAWCWSNIQCISFLQLVYWECDRILQLHRSVGCISFQVNAANLFRFFLNNSFSIDFSQWSYQKDQTFLWWGRKTDLLNLGLTHSLCLNVFWLPPSSIRDVMSYQDNKYFQCSLNLTLTDHILLMELDLFVIQFMHLTLPVLIFVKVLRYAKAYLFQLQSDLHQVVS